MSSQRGNVKKTGPPKHNNKTAFKNNKYDSSKQTQKINSLDLFGLCQRCDEVLRWKIKFKKYKPLTQPKKCIKCEEKTVTRAYYTLCERCGREGAICCKCGQKKDILMATSKAAQDDSDRRLEEALPYLKERERRTLLRLAAKGEEGKVRMEEALQNVQTNGSDHDDDDDEEEDEDETSDLEGADADDSHSDDNIDSDNDTHVES